MAGSWSKKETIKERFLKYTSIDNSGCWLWTGNIDYYGYGRLGFKMKTYRANRLAVLIFKNIDAGKNFVCHKCDNPRCVNPDHLFLGTQKENMADCKSKHRTAIGKKNGMAKLSEDDVKNILLLSKSGLTHQEIGNKFNVSRSNIGSILNKKRWRHLSQEV